MYLACPGTTSFPQLLVPTKNKIVVVFVWVGLNSNYVRLMKSSASELALKTKFKAFTRENEPLFSVEAPAGYPNKNSNNRKIESARGTMGRGKNLASSLSPSHCSPRAFFFLFSSLPTIQRGLCGGEREWVVFEDVRGFDISNAFKRKVDWNGLQTRSVILRDRFVILARKVYICIRFFA